MSKTVVQISSRRRKSPQPESAVHQKAPQSPPRYEVALHGSNRFSHEADICFKVHNIPHQNVLKVRKNFSKFLHKKNHTENVLEGPKKVMKRCPKFYKIIQGSMRFW